MCKEHTRTKVQQSKERKKKKAEDAKHKKSETSLTKGE
jgi:hypothetical protein